MIRHDSGEGPRPPGPTPPLEEERVSIIPTPAEIGGYRLLHEIGRGGFGSVHLGENARGERAAVKLLHVTPGTDPRFFELFEREVEAARRVSPFCVARVLDADPRAAHPWIASEYIEGPTLAREVRENGPRTGTDLDRLAVSTATALSAIHAAGVMHRDLKPGNIMLAADGPRVIDFGIARPFEEATSLTASAIIGTLQYMAPEQLEDGARLTPAVDVYAWGAVMVFAATGRPAFSASTQRALMRSVLMDTPDCSALPPRLRGVVEGCLDKDPGARPSARELIDLLTASPEGGPVTPPLASVAPPPRPEARSEEGAREGPPLWFVGNAVTTPDRLAEVAREHWEEAVDLLGDPRELGALVAWLNDRDGLEWIASRVADEAGRDPEYALVRLVAGLRPDLPPVFRGRNVTLSALTRRVRKARGLFSEEGLTPATMVALSRHHCAEPGHDCRGFPCPEYRRFALDLEAAGAAAEEAARRYEPWLTRVSWSGTGPVDVGSPAFVGSMMTALLDTRFWREHTRAVAASADDRWSDLVPATRVSGERGEAAGREAVHLRVVEALAALSERESRTKSRSADLRAYTRAGVREATAVFLSLVAGVVPVAVISLTETPVGAAVTAVLFLAPLVIQQSVSWSRRGWRRRRPPEWMAIEPDGVQATTLRLSELLDAELERLDRAYERAWG